MELFSAGRVEFVMIPMAAVILLSTTGSTTAQDDEECKYVEVVDTKYQESREGRYTYVGERCYHRPVYVQRTDKVVNYLFYQELADGWGGWMIGTTACINKGGMAARDPALVPQNVRAGVWEEVYADSWHATTAYVKCTNELTTGAIAGIALGVVALIVIAITVSVFVCKDTAKKRSIRTTRSSSRRPQISVISQNNPGGGGVRRATVRGSAPQQCASGACNTSPTNPLERPGHWVGYPQGPPSYSSATAPPMYRTGPRGTSSHHASVHCDPSTQTAVYSTMPTVCGMDMFGPPPSYSESQNHPVYPDPVRRNSRISVTEGHNSRRNSRDDRSVPNVAVAGVHGENTGNLGV